MRDASCKVVIRARQSTEADVASGYASEAGAGNPGISYHGCGMESRDFYVMTCRLSGRPSALGAGAPSIGTDTKCGGLTDRYASSTVNADSTDNTDCG